MISRALIAMLPLLAFALVRPAVGGSIPKDWTWDDDEKTRSEHAALEDKPMPALDVSGWVNGNITAADLKDKIVVLDFYATWCGPCMAAIPHNNELMNKFKDKGVLVLGVCTSDRGQERMEQTVKDRGIKYPTAKDPNLEAEKAWRVSYYPTYAIVDRKGIVRVVGLQPEYVERVVENLLKQEKK